MMRPIFLLISFISSLTGMSNEKYPKVFDNYAQQQQEAQVPITGNTPSIETRADTLRKEIHKDCVSFTCWDCITSRLAPTLLFGTAALSYGYGKGKKGLLLDATYIKKDVNALPRFLSISAAILASCMIYSYYKPVVIRGYWFLYNKLMNWKKGF